jgi:hypothetical protein
MVFDDSEKFLIFKKITFLVLFSRKIGKIFKNPDWADKENFVLTNRATGWSGIFYRTGSDRAITGTGYNSNFMRTLYFVVDYLWKCSILYLKF